MSDLDITLIADKLGKSLENAAERITEELNAAIKDLSHAAYANIVSHIQSSTAVDKNKKDYLKSLKFQDIGNNSYVIYLDDEWANKLEEGFAPYDMKAVLLKSTKVVGVGSRAGEPWVRTGKEGQKYAAVPFEHKPFAAKEGDLAADIKTLFATNRQGKSQKLTKIFKDDFGNPIAGKVASVAGEGIAPNLQNLVKYQHVSEKGAVSSLYTTFRIISENSTGWNHPGFSGYNIFTKVERELEREMENIINTLLD